MSQVKMEPERCATCPQHEARIRFVEKTLEECIPEIKGAIQDVTTCLNRLDETIHGVLTIKEQITKHDGRIRNMEDFRTRYEAAKQAIEQSLNKKIAIMTAIISALIMLSNWFMLYQQRMSVKEEIGIIHQLSRTRESAPTNHNKWRFRHDEDYWPEQTDKH